MSTIAPITSDIVISMIKTGMYPNELKIAKVLSFEKPSKWPLNSEWSFLSLEISSAHRDEEGEIFARFDVAHQNLLGKGF